MKEGIKTMIYEEILIVNFFPESTETGISGLMER